MTEPAPWAPWFRQNTILFDALSGMLPSTAVRACMRDCPRAKGRLSFLSPPAKFSVHGALPPHKELSVTPGSPPWEHSHETQSKSLQTPWKPEEKTSKSQHSQRLKGWLGWSRTKGRGF